MPSILIGGALGRLAGEAYRALDLVPGGVHVRPGVWAVCGAAAVLAGVRAELDRTGLGGPHQTSELSISVKSKSIRLIFGRIDCSH